MSVSVICFKALIAILFLMALLAIFLAWDSIADHDPDKLKYSYRARKEIALEAKATFPAVQGYRKELNLKAEILTTLAYLIACYNLGYYYRQQRLKYPSDKELLLCELPLHQRLEAEGFRKMEQALNDWFNVYKEQLKKQVGNDYKLADRIMEDFNIPTYFMDVLAKKERWTAK